MVQLETLEMADRNDNLIIMSYNCRGFNTLKSLYIKSLLAKCSVLFLQEHWLSHDQLLELDALDINFLSTGISGFDNSDILLGRPFGGCAILWRSDLTFNTQIIPTDSSRICAVRMSNDVLKLLFVNVYLPYESNDERTTDFIDQLSIIENLITANCDCHVIVGGDFNADFQRDKLHTTILNSFCDNNNLIPADRHEKCKVDYTYNFGMTRFCTLDHFLLSGEIFQNGINNCRVLHDVDNMSDHDPLELCIMSNCNYLDCRERVFVPRASWVKASEVDIEKYRWNLSSRLHNIPIPVDMLLCNDLLCNDATHLSAINTLAHDLNNALIDATKTCIPLSCNRQTSKWR
jgi:hypothetical protein